MLVLTNDDGIDAPGLLALEQAVRRLDGVPYVVIAPSDHCSGCGHQVTTGRSFRVEARGEGRYAVQGTPADCVRLAIHHLCPELVWVVSGINAGGNLGTDVLHSGTVAAVREAVIHGKTGIAVSHYIARGRAIDWERAVDRTARTLARLLKEPPELGTFRNVNLPHPGPDAPEPEIVFCPVDASPLPLSYRIESEDTVRYDGDYQKRLRHPGKDVDVCFGGAIAVSRVHVLGPDGGLA